MIGIGSDGKPRALSPFPERDSGFSFAENKTAQAALKIFTTEKRTSPECYVEPSGLEGRISSPSPFSRIPSWPNLFDERSAPLESGSLSLDQASYPPLSGEELISSYRSGQSPSFPEGVLQFPSLGFPDDPLHFFGEPFIGQIPQTEAPKEISPPPAQYAPLPKKTIKRRLRHPPTYIPPSYRFFKRTADLVSSSFTINNLVDFYEYLEAFQIAADEIKAACPRDPENPSISRAIKIFIKKSANQLKDLIKKGSLQVVLFAQKDPVLKQTDLIIPFLDQAQEIHEQIEQARLLVIYPPGNPYPFGQFLARLEEEDPLIQTLLARFPISTRKKRTLSLV